MSTFKKGDRVRILASNDAPVSRGDTGRIVNDDGKPEYRDGSGRYTVEMDSDGDTWRFNVSDLEYERSPERSSERSEDSELAKLVDAANERLEAVRKLRNKYSDQLECRSEGADWRPLNSIPVIQEYRIKPKPLLEPFTLKDSGHTVVSLNGTDLHIGCVQTTIKDAFSVLNDLVTANLSTSRKGGFELVAAKKGPQHAQGVMTWADADQLLSELEKLK